MRYNAATIERTQQDKTRTALRMGQRDRVRQQSHTSLYTIQPPAAPHWSKPRRDRRSGGRRGDSSLCTVRGRLQRPPSWRNVRHLCRPPVTVLAARRRPRSLGGGHICTTAPPQQHQSMLRSRPAPCSRPTSAPPDSSRPTKMAALRAPHSPVPTWRPARR